MRVKGGRGVSSSLSYGSTRVIEVWKCDSPLLLSHTVCDDSYSTGAGEEAGEEEHQPGKAPGHLPCQGAHRQICRCIVRSDPPRPFLLLRTSFIATCAPSSPEQPAFILIFPQTIFAGLFPYNHPSSLSLFHANSPSSFTD